MSNSERYPSYATCVAHALSNSRQPLSVDGLLACVGNQRPLGKGARSAIYRAIGKLFQAVPVAPGRYGWLSHLLAGSNFRHPLTSEEARRGFLLLDELEHIVFFPQFFQTNRPEHRSLEVELFGGPTIQAEAAIERKTWSLRLGPEFSDWIDEHGGQNRDDLLIIATDAVAGKYQVRLNLHEMRDESVIRHQNIQLALLAEELVAEDRRTRTAMPTWELAARLIARDVYHQQPPPDDLHYVLHEYSMLRFRDGVGYQLEQNEDAEPADQLSRFVFTEQNYLEGNFSDQQQGRSLNGDHRQQDSDSFRSPLQEDDPTAFSNDVASDDVANNDLAGDSLDGDIEGCPAYEFYLETFFARYPDDQPLDHEDFHLLEAELEQLTRLEVEFGRLLHEQSERKDYLSQRLFIDPNEFITGGWDMPDDPDGEIPPFWSN